MKYPVAKLVLPKDLKGVKNGCLSDALMRPITPSGKLHHLAARAWEALHDAAMQVEGTKPFKPTSTADAYRSLEQQLSGFVSRFVEKDTGTGTIRTYKNKKWFLKKGMAPMASPGTSNHGWGLAIDVWSANGARLDWMLQNCEKYGFSWEVQSEPWHIRYVRGEDVPQAVLDFEAKAAVA